MCEMSVSFDPKKLRAFVAECRPRWCASSTASLIGTALLLVLACALSAAHARASRDASAHCGVVGVHEWRGGQLATMTATESDEDLSKLTKKVLKERLQTLGLRVSGKKRVLIERLEQHIASNANAPGKHRKPHSTPGQTLHAVIMLSAIRLPSISCMHLPQRSWRASRRWRTVSSKQRRPKKWTDACRPLAASSGPIRPLRSRRILARQTKSSGYRRRSLRTLRSPPSSRASRPSLETRQRSRRGGRRSPASGNEHGNAEPSFFDLLAQQQAKGQDKGGPVATTENETPQLPSLPSLPSLASFGGGGGGGGGGGVDVTLAIPAAGALFIASALLIGGDATP